MNTPRLEIYLDNDLKLCFAKVERAGAESQLIVDLDLDELKSYGPEGAENRVGVAVLGTLKVWHKKVFENWELSDHSMSGSPTEDDYDIAMQLIGKSVSAKTGAHVRTIDILLSESDVKDDEMRKFVEESWPIIRARLEKFGSAETDKTDS